MLWYYSIFFTTVMKFFLNVPNLFCFIHILLIEICGWMLKMVVRVVKSNSNLISIAGSAFEVILFICYFLSLILKHQNQTILAFTF